MNKKLRPETAEDIKAAVSFEGKLERLKAHARHNPLVSVIFQHQHMSLIAEREALIWLAYAAIENMEDLQDQLLKIYQYSANPFVGVDIGIKDETIIKCGGCNRVITDIDNHVCPGG